MEVRIRLNGEADILEDLVVVTPSRVRHVDGAVALVELGEEQGAQMDGTSARDRLERSRSLLGDGGGVAAEDKLSSLGGEAVDSSNRTVLVVELRVVTEDLISL
jgi:hypothetical protein